MVPVCYLRNCLELGWPLFDSISFDIAALGSILLCVPPFLSLLITPGTHSFNLDVFCSHLWGIVVRGFRNITPAWVRESANPFPIFE